MHSGDAVGDGVDEVGVRSFPNDGRGLEALPQLLHGVAHAFRYRYELIILEAASMDLA